MPPTLGKLFYLRNKGNNFYLDASGLSGNTDKVSPGKTEITLWAKKEVKKGVEANSQVWYWDAITSTLRSYLTDLCLDLNRDKKAIINFLNFEGSTEYKRFLRNSPSTNSNKSLSVKHIPKRSSTKSLPGPEEPISLQFTQQWRFNKKANTIENVVEDGKVLEVVAGSPEAGAEVCVSHLHFRASQLWVMEPLPIKYMYILTQFNDGYVMDLLGGKESAGATVGLYVKRKRDVSCQLWYEDETGNLRSKINDKLVLSATATSLRTESAENTTQRWLICGNRIINAADHSYVLGVGRKRNSFSIDDNDTYYLCSSLYQGRASQHWSFMAA